MKIRVIIIIVSLLISAVFENAECGQVSASVFIIAAIDRVAAKAGVAVTLTFTTQTALATGGKITLNYPAGFFAATPNPAANIAGTTSVGSMTATSAITGNSIVITTAVAGIAATTAFTVTDDGSCSSRRKRHRHHGANGL